MPQEAILFDGARLERRLRPSSPTTWRKARDGWSVAELVRDGASVVTRDQVLEGTAEMTRDVRVEAIFPDGTKLVTIHQPIR